MSDLATDKLGFSEGKQRLKVSITDINSPRHIARIVIFDKDDSRGVQKKKNVSEL